MRPLNHFQHLFLLCFAAIHVALTTAAPETQLPVEAFKEFGVPQIERYTPRDTGLHDPVKSIVSLPNGALAFLSESQLITFDGTQWSRANEISWPTSTYFTANGELLVGASNGLARMHHNSFGGYDIERITTNEDYPDSPLTLKYIAVARGYTFSLHGTYLLRVAPDGTSQTLPLENWASTLLSIDDEIYVSGGTDALLNKWDWDKESLVSIQDVFEDSVYEWIEAVTPRKAGGYWLRTDSQNIIVFDGERTWLWPGNEHLAANDIVVNCILELSNDELLLGTNKHGALIFDTHGVLTRSLSKPQGLDDSAILSAGTDPQGGIWLSTKRSVTRIRNNPTSLVFDERHGLPETIGSIQIFDDKLVLGARSGIYMSNQDATKASELFSLRHSITSVSDILALEDHIFIAASFIYTIDRSGNLETLSYQGGTNLWRPSRYPDIVLVGSHKGVALYRKSGGKWAFEQYLPGDGNEVFSMTETASGQVFGSLSNDKVAWIRLDDGPPRIDTIPIPISMNGAWSFPIEIQGEVYLNTIPCYKWDDASTAFIPSPEMVYYIGEGPYGFDNIFGTSSEKAWVSINNRHGQGVPRPSSEIVGLIASMNESLEARAKSIGYDVSNNAYIGGSFGLLMSMDPFGSGIDEAQAPRLHTFLSLNDQQKLPIESQDGKPIHLKPTQNSLRIEAELPHFYATNLHKFQIYIEGLDPTWPPFQSLPIREVTNIPAGSYTLRLNALNSSGQRSTFSLPFIVAKAWYLKTTAILAYIVLAIVLVALLVYGYNRNQIRRSRKLARLVEERTEEVNDQNRTLIEQAERLEKQNEDLEEKTDELTTTTQTLSTTLHQLQEMQEQLVTTARTAGKAEIAINVLHNVGNVLNSLNVSLNVLNEKVENSNAPRLGRITQLLSSHEDNIADFLTNDSKGKNVPNYLVQLSSALDHEIKSIQSELSIMGDDIDHVKSIISAQQTHAKTSGIIETIHLKEICDTATSISFAERDEQNIEILNEIPAGLTLHNDKHRLLDILLNLISNAADAIQAQNPDLGIISFQALQDETAATIELHVKDNGTGIADDDFDKLFSHGFTTKESGHGFGLHSCANAAKGLGGQLALESRGSDRGAIAKLTLPLRPSK